LETLDVENINHNFYNWFKDSKVVDKSGNPISVYHGSKTKYFNEFSFSKDIGFHFSKSISIAKDMAGTFEDDYGFTNEIKPIEAYLSIQNLVGIPDLEFWRKNDIIKYVEKENNFYRKNKPPMNFEYNSSMSLLDNIKLLAFELNEMNGDWKSIDGFIYYNEYEGNFTSNNKWSFIALKPNQIKSVNNDGTWDLNDNNIYS
jgi:hypothetical protein